MATFTRGWSREQRRDAMTFWRNVQAYGSCVLTAEEVQRAAQFMAEQTEWLLGYEDDVLFGVVGYMPAENVRAGWEHEVTLGAITPGTADAALDALVLANVTVGRPWPAGECVWGTETPSDQPFAVALRRAYGAAIRESASAQDGWTVFEGRVIDGQIAVW